MSKDGCAVVPEPLAANTDYPASTIREVGNRFYGTHRPHECMKTEVHNPCHGLRDQVGRGKVAGTVASFLFEEIMMRFAIC